MQNKLEEKVNRFIAEAQHKIDVELEYETRNYNYIRATAIHSEGNIFRKAVAFIKGERIELEEHVTNVTNANDLSEENRNDKSDEARINTVRSLFKSSLAHFNEAKQKIESHWNHVINSKILAAELGYKELIDQVTHDLRTCDRIRIELKRIQDEYNTLEAEYDDVMKKIDKVNSHNGTIKSVKKIKEEKR